MESKTCEEGCALAKQLHRCVQAPKLGNHWLVLMIVEVGAPVPNLPNSRRVQHLADVCHQLVHMFIYTIQHMFKHGCISLLKCRIVHKGVNTSLYTMHVNLQCQQRCVY